MIDKLRKRIFWIIQIALSVIILGVVILFATFSYRNIITSSVMFMDRLEGRAQVKEDKPKEFGEEKDIEGVYKFELNGDKVILKSGNAESNMESYAIEACSKKSNEGYIGNYIYKIRNVGMNNSKEVTLVESEDAIKQLKMTVVIAVIVAIFGVLIVYIIARKISFLIVKPVNETFEKQKQFVSDASHELKTPLAVIKANADVLQDKVGENKWISYIQNEISSMNKLVNDLLVLARLEKENTGHRQKFDLSKEVQMSVAVFESMIYEKKINLDTNITDGIMFNGDKEDVKHIISILIDNAIKHTNEGGKIIVSVEREKNNVKIKVANQGDPIPEQECEKIFERFYRVDKSRNRSEKRYGLGLSIAKGIVNKYGGSIQAASKDGFTNFVVKI